jgi:hypothetical protein
VTAPFIGRTVGTVAGNINGYPYLMEYLTFWKNRKIGFVVSDGEHLSNP